MGYISQENLVQNMTPEQRIMIASFYAKFDVGSGIVNKKIKNIELLAYTGNIAASEYLVYSASKMYIGLNIIFSTINANIEAADTSIISFFNENNADVFSIYNYSAIFNVTEKFICNPCNLSNIAFSYFTLSNYSYINFIGYRITLI